jgi:Ca2+-binding EF-hand superfamily protein
MEEFQRFDLGGNGNLEARHLLHLLHLHSFTMSQENQAMMLLEHRGETKTLHELRAMVSDMDKNRDHQLSFLEWAACHYEKSWVSDAAYACCFDQNLRGYMRINTGGAPHLRR